MKKPKIGITTAWSVETWGDSIESRGYNYVGRSYIEAIIKAGGIPVLIPQFEQIDIKSVLEDIDGLLLSGGGDAKKFSKEDMPDLRKQQPLRYDFEAELVKAAKELKKPIMGICRGFQMLVEVFGGSLSDELIEGHKQKDPNGGVPWHKVNLAEDSFLYSVVSSNQWDVNSFHVQKVNQVPEGFRTAAVADDGVIEAIEYMDDAFILGTQFHPEELIWSDERTAIIFKKFIEESKIRR
ncbi:type 1 glutamine amidotransferase [Sedimentibacter hydroxybenzoicus DSM 7310]|uniref:Type 1 glutamine amidotransferase n=1 Tax=Sedimentibacter hydroxybenzoicus DSM 7310 TaxID=1123245 RepID=A0A974BJ16_SEDHY|nr:type 1 glutamine amidotransferase [Sedimentibacter hydroxybenzoicus]NYB73993.1 type 1 glutamine amidotransferase [Sedimentibacter hydroxybenzoicus DSM 7310]